MPHPVVATLGHPAPMLIRFGRGGRTGLFSAGQSTAVEIRGVDPLDMADPGEPPPGIPPGTRLLDRHLWAPVRGGMGTGRGIESLPLDVAISLLSKVPGRAATGLCGPVAFMPGIPPLRNPYGELFGVAHSMEAAGRVPASAAGQVDAARDAASRAVRDHAATHLVHDGRHLYFRLPPPLLRTHQLREVTVEWRSGLGAPGFLHSRLGPDGELPFGDGRGEPRLLPLAEALSRFLEGVETDNADIDAFVGASPAALVGHLRHEDGPDAERHCAALWPLLVDGCLNRRPADGVEAATDAIRDAAAFLREAMDASLRRKIVVPNREHPLTYALDAHLGFVDHVVRPALAAPVTPDDQAEMGYLAP